MALSRRQAVGVSGAALASLALGLPGGLTVAQAQAAAVAAPPAAPTPDHLVPATLRTLAPLPLEADGSAKVYTAADITPITGPAMWRYTKGTAPDGETDYKKLAIKITAGGMTTLSGTMTYNDVAKLPSFSQTVLLQCGAANPHGVVKWTGVRFSDVTKMLGVQPLAQYCRFIARDGYYTDEDLETATHPQVMLAWMMNDQPLPVENGAPVRVVMPFRYGARSIKAVTEIAFASPTISNPQLVR